MNLQNPTFFYQGWSVESKLIRLYLKPSYTSNVKNINMNLEPMPIIHVSQHALVAALIH